MEKLKLTGSGSRAFGPARLYWREGAPLRISLAYRGAYGLGERFDALNQKGRRAVCEVEEKFCFQGGKDLLPRAVLLDGQRLRALCGHLREHRF